MLTEEKATVETPVGRRLVEEVATLAWEKKALDLIALEVGELVGYTDYFVVCSGTSNRQVNALSEHVENELKKKYNVRPSGVEGRDSGRWVLLDYIDVVVHVLYQPVRDYYEIEKLWSDAPRVELEEPKWVAEEEGLSRWEIE